MRAGATARSMHVRVTAGVVLAALLGVCAAGCGGDDSADRPAGEQAAHPERARDLREHRRPREVLRGFARFAESVGAASAGVTVGSPGRASPQFAGDLMSGTAWSTIKVPIAVRVLQRARGAAGLTPAQRGQIDRALTASDNSAAAQLFASLGTVTRAAHEVETVLRAVGDDGTRVSTRGRDGFSPYGQTDWSLVHQHQFMAALAGGCLSAESGSSYLLGLMGRVTSDRWGLGSAGVAARWKGGWGPSTDGRYLVRQMGLLRLGGRDRVVTLAAVARDGSFESAQRVATAVARWLARRPLTRLDPSPAGC